jgi:RNA polymerase sigma factor (sigma-70 family)
MIGVERAGERGSVVVGSALDRTEFERVYYRQWPDVFRYALLVSRNHHDAEDIASEAFRRALEAWRAGRGPRGEVLPWLLVITRRVAIDRHRRGRLFGWLPLDRAPEPEDAREEAALRRSETWIWFEEIAAMLPDSQRDALLLRFAFDLTDEQASKVIGTSIGNVRTLVSRGLATLRERPEVMER